MRAADDFPLLQPVLTDGAQNAQWLHGQFWIENVVNDSFELECVVGEGHQLRGVGTGHVERVRELCKKWK